ncbi:hypothetical protein POKO110462_22410 [Pontibacter korlensis]|uniref:Uncharacterized protein n=1 Tax=Pontibacter korlensis TaxID=400092 RepID=A0A0E3UWC8_9BACT|nr:hypothetical protein [Pontibacter korlensis]AKD03297.1 hypothetical protein PKOR_09395 [Pontibacter korlensis]
MNLTQYEYLNKILAVVDACQVDCKISFSFNLPAEFYDLSNPENKKGQAIKKYVDQNFDFSLTQENKENLIEDLGSSFVDGEICHYLFIKDSIKIGEGFDNCEINYLNPKYFHLTAEHLEILGDVYLHLTEEIN